MEIRQRIDHINNWIKENRHITDPNMYEIFDCIIEVGKETEKYKFEKMENGEATNDELIEAKEGLMEMFILRKLDKESMVFNKSNELFEGYEPLIELMYNLFFASITGDYIDPQNNFDSVIKQEVLRKTAGISLYIRQQYRDIEKNKEDKAIYDNEEEFKEYSAKCEYYLNEMNPKYRQFEKEVENIYLGIEKEFDRTKKNKPQQFTL